MRRGIASVGCARTLGTGRRRSKKKTKRSAHGFPKTSHRDRSPICQKKLGLCTNARKKKQVCKLGSSMNGELGSPHKSVFACYIISTNNPYNLGQLIFNKKQPATYESRFRAEKMRYIRQVSPRLTYKKVSRSNLFFLHSFFGLSCQGSLIKPAHCGGTKEKRGWRMGVAP